MGSAVLGMREGRLEMTIRWVCRYVVFAPLASLVHRRVCGAREAGRSIRGMAIGCAVVGRRCGMTGGQRALVRTRKGGALRMLGRLSIVSAAWKAERTRDMYKNPGETCS